MILEANLYSILAKSVQENLHIIETELDNASCLARGEIPILSDERPVKRIDPNTVQERSCRVARCGRL